MTRTRRRKRGLPGYNKLGIAAKRALARERMRAPAPVRCSACHTAVMPSELGAHQAQRCPGEPLVRQSEHASEAPRPPVAQVLSEAAPCAAEERRSSQVPPAPEMFSQSEVATGDE